MSDDFKQAIDGIRASEELKSQTLALLAQKGQTSFRVRRRSVRAVLCAARLLLVCGLSGYFLWTVPVSFVSIDVNPSIELSVNRFDRVVGVEGLNRDGESVLREVELKNLTYTQAIDTLLDSAPMEPYLSADAHLSFTVVSDREDTVIGEIQRCKRLAGYAVQCRGASRQVMEEAHRQGLSFGKYQIYLELLRYDPGLTPLACRQLSAGQLQSMLAQYTGAGEDSAAGQDAPLGCPRGSQGGQSCAEEGGAAAGKGSGDQGGCRQALSGAEP